MIERRKWGRSPSFGPRQWLRHKLLLKELRKNLPRGVVLDAGCGDGRLARLMAQRNYEVLAFDESKENFKNITPRAYISNAYFWLGKIDQIPLPDNSLDGLVAGDVLEHLQDDQQAVQEFFRVLKPGGIALITVPADPEKWSIDDDWSGHYRRYKKEELEKLFSKTGFQTEQIYYWGWPIIWIYYRLYYIHMLERAQKAKTHQELVKGKKESNWLKALFWFALLVDQVPLKTNWGIGLLGIFKKRHRR